MRRNSRLLPAAGPLASALGAGSDTPVAHKLSQSRNDTCTAHFGRPAARRRARRATVPASRELSTLGAYSSICLNLDRRSGNCIDGTMPTGRHKGRCLRSICCWPTRARRSICTGDHKGWRISVHSLQRCREHVAGLIREFHRLRCRCDRQQSDHVGHRHRGEFYALPKLTGLEGRVEPADHLALFLHLPSGPVQYDLSTGTFSPDGRVFQTDYAQKAVDNSGCGRVAAGGAFSIAWSVCGDLGMYCLINNVHSLHLQKL